MLDAEGAEGREGGGEPPATRTPLRCPGARSSPRRGHAVKQGSSRSVPPARSARRTAGDERTEVSWAAGAGALGALGRILQRENRRRGSEGQAKSLKSHHGDHSGIEEVPPGEGQWGAVLLQARLQLGSEGSG